MVQKENKENLEFIPEILRIIIEFLDPDDYISFKSTSSLFHKTFLQSPEAILFNFQKNFEKLSPKNQKFIIDKQEIMLEKQKKMLDIQQKREEFWITWNILITWSNELTISFELVPEIPYFSTGAFDEIHHIMKSFQILKFEKGFIELPFKMCHTSCDVILNTVPMVFSFIDINSSKICVFSLSAFNDEILIYLENDENGTIDFEIKIDHLLNEFNDKVIDANRFVWGEEELYGFLYLIAYSLLEV
eukprot:gene4347-7703_t